MQSRTNQCHIACLKPSAEQIAELQGDGRQNKKRRSANNLATPMLEDLDLEASARQASMKGCCWLPRAEKSSTELSYQYWENIWAGQSVFCIAVICVCRAGSSGICGHKPLRCVLQTGPHKAMFGTSG